MRRSAIRKEYHRTNVRGIPTQSETGRYLHGSDVQQEEPESMHDLVRVAAVEVFAGVGVGGVR